MRASFGVFLALLCGCAAPHRAAVSFHEHRAYQGRPDGMIALDIWRDSERGGGWFLLTTSDVQSLSAIHANQDALGGNSTFTAGPIKLTGDPSTVKALGVAIGAVVAEALKTAVKP